MKKIIISADGRTLKRVAKYCKGEIIVPDGVEVIGKRAFAGRGDITSIILPSSVKELGEEAFEGCSALTCIIIPEGVEIIPRRAFADCYELASVSLPSSLKTIEKETFANCTGLTRIEIPDVVETIGTKAFTNCRSLKEVVMPAALTELGEKSFHTCTNLKEIDIPIGVETIPENCFGSCGALESAVFHEGLKVISKSAFEYCKIKHIEICSTVNSIGVDAFHWNAPLSISVDKGNLTYCDAECNVIMERESGTVIYGSASSSIPNQSSRIRNRAFQGSGCPNVLVVPPSVKVIENGAFLNCDDGSIILLQEGVTTIKWSAFQQKNGASLKVYLPSTVNHIEGQFSSVEFRLDAANPYYHYDADGHNIISKDGVLVWGHLVNGIPTEGVNRVEVVNYGKVPYSELTVPNNVKYISDSICRLLNHSDGFKTLKLSKGTKLCMSWDSKTTCEITVTIPRKKSASGISKNTEYIIPRGSSWMEINDFLGNDTIV